MMVIQKSKMEVVDMQSLLRTTSINVLTADGQSELRGRKNRRDSAKIARKT